MLLPASMDAAIGFSVKTGTPRLEERGHDLPVAVERLRRDDGVEALGVNHLLRGRVNLRHAVTRRHAGGQVRSQLGQRHNLALRQ